MTVSVEEIERWDAGDVREVFHATRSRAEAAFEAADGIADLPAFGSWGGKASEAAKASIGKTRKDLDAHGNEVQAVAKAASKAADDVEQVKNDLAHLKADIAAEGFELDPISNIVQPGPAMQSDMVAMLGAEAKREALQARLAAILARAVAVDQELASAIAMATGQVPVLPGQPVAKAAGSTESQPEPRTWQDMMLPPDASKAPGVGGRPDAAGAGGAKPGQPENLNQALDQLAGQPVPAAQGPRLDPTKVEEFKATARKLMQQDGVPADQIEQRLNAMVANAQKPLVPYHPPAAPPPPKPGFGEGFGDAWRSTEDSLHSLTGQNGLDAFKDSWKGVGENLFDTVKDPYGTAVRNGAEELAAARNNPAYWLGQKTYDASAAAATLPFGGEAALGRGALDDVARGAVPHELLDTPAGHVPTPAVSHPTPLPGVDSPLHTGDYTPPTGHLPPTGDPGSFGYDLNGDRLPYANSRPAFAPGQEASVWDLSRDAQLTDIQNRILGLPEPGADQQWVRLHPDGPIGEDWIVDNGHRLIEWQPGDPRKGLWDMGHVEGQEYRYLREDYLSGAVTYQDFLDTFRDPTNYRVQDPFRNRSHIDEGP